MKLKFLQLKKALCAALLMAFFAPWAAQAQETVTIGEGTSSGNNCPFGTYYNYSITEQLYTAEEIGMAGEILSISFYYNGTAAKDFPIDVYMQNVNATDLSTGISLTEAEQVFSGTLSVTTNAGWVTIVLDTPFYYDGTSNLLIGFNKGYVYYFSGNTWRYTSASNMARYSQNDNNAYSLSTVPGTVTNNRPNIQIEIAPDSGSTCPKPYNLDVAYEGGTTAIVTWNSNNSVDLKVNDTMLWLEPIVVKATTVNGPMFSVLLLQLAKSVSKSRLGMNLLMVMVTAGIIALSMWLTKTAILSRP